MLAPGVTLLLQPRVGWPKQMTVGRQHLVTVDLALVTPDGDPAPWQLQDEEEITYTFNLDGGADFDHWAVHDAAVVLHRFGGSYGPAEFVVTPRKEGERSLWLTIINPGGIPVGDHELGVTVLPRAESPGGESENPKGEDPDPKDANGLGTGGKEFVEAGAAPGEAAPGQSGAGEETSGDETIPAPVQDEPFGRTLGDTLLDPLDLALTRLDFGLVDAGHTGFDGARTGSRQAPAQDTKQDVDPAEPPEQAPLRLAEWYNLVGLRRSASGNLHLALLPLFAPGTPPGARASFTVRCAPADQHGTVFAVIADRPDDERRRRYVRSAQSASIPPGVYQVTAELLYPGPGHVRFDGLPATPREDPRQWSEIMEAVPQWLGHGAGPTHLVAAIEICGEPELVAERVECVRRLVTHVAAEADVPVSYSVLTYGPHSINPHNREYPEVPVTTHAWAATSDAALDTLGRLARRPAVTGGYTRAAQIECVLAELDARLTGGEGRPVIVTAGGRPAHPPARDASSHLIPCIYRRDWHRSIDRLARHGGIAYGAIHDNGSPNDLWRFLGNDVGTAIDDFSAAEFALALGLTGGYAQFLPLPLIDGRQSEEANA